MADTNPWVLDLTTDPPSIYNDTITEHAQNAFQPPYPNCFWQINNDGDDIIHAGEVDYYHYTLNIPYPYVFWFTNQFGNDVTHYAYYNHEPLGACRRCTHLTNITIPRSVKKIGSEMATNTLLSDVTIANDCEYSSKSFPSNCTVNFYPT